MSQSFDQETSCDGDIEASEPDRYSEIDAGVSFSDYAHVDDTVITTETASISDIIQSVQGAAPQDRTASDSEVEEPEALPLPSATEARVAVDTLQRFVQAKTHDASELEVLCKLKKIVERCARADKRQTTVLEFFKQ